MAYRAVFATHVLTTQIAQSARKDSILLLSQVTSEVTSNIIIIPDHLKHSFLLASRSAIFQVMHQQFYFETPSIKWSVERPQS